MHNVISYLYTSDQHDRQRFHASEINQETLAMHDAERFTKLRSHLSTHTIISADEYYKCAVIFQHSSAVSDIEYALVLATKAKDMGHSDAGRLYAIISDRLCVMNNQPQKYGTQYNIDHTKQTVELFPIDESITGAKRLELGLPRLSDLVRDAEQIQRTLFSKDTAYSH